jgi:hypothetical protein
LCTNEPTQAHIQPHRKSGTNGSASKPLTAESASTGQQPGVLKPGWGLAVVTAVLY